MTNKIPQFNFNIRLTIDKKQVSQWSYLWFKRQNDWPTDIWNDSPIDHWTERQKDRQTDRQTNWPNKRPIKRRMASQPDRQSESTYFQFNSQIDQQTERLRNQTTNWPTQTDPPIDRKTDRSSDTDKQTNSPTVRKRDRDTSWVTISQTTTQKRKTNQIHGSLANQMTKCYRVLKNRGVSRLK